jgi:hypothetical protein
LHLLCGVFAFDDKMAEVVCQECGGKSFSDARFCSHCGKTMTATVGQAGLTDAVREVSKGDQGEKYGQQKWGLFETNSQRNRGISTETSLQEIDDAVQHGVVVRKGAPTQYREVTTSSGGAGAGAGAGGFGSSSGASFSFPTCLSIERLPFCRFPLPPFFFRCVCCFCRG